MARNRVDISLDSFTGKQGRYKAKKGQSSGFQSNGPRSFKLKRKGQDFINNSSSRRRNTGANFRPKQGLSTKSRPADNGKSFLAARKQIKQNLQAGSARGDQLRGLLTNKSKNAINLVGKSSGTLSFEKSKLELGVGSQKLSTRPNENSKSLGKPNKLFTKGFDARKRIEAKRKPHNETKKPDVAVVKDLSWVQLVTSRQEQKDADLNRRRALSMIGGKMQVISRIQEEEERKTLFTGNSLKITALQTESERQQNREATIQGDNAILITATNNYQNIHENKAVEEVRHSQSPDLSDYSLFEARRKAEADRAAAAEIPKLSSLHPISRPRRASPVHHTEEDNVAMASSSRILVTNLHPNVSPDDIFELFGAVAPIKSSRLLRNGVAEVIYETSDDALLAYRKYNGRNLDGQPMICKVTFPDQQLYQPPPKFHQVETKPPSTKTSSRPVVFTVKI